MNLLAKSKTYALALALVLLSQMTTPLGVMARYEANSQPIITIPDGTEFNVETTEEISSKTATEGDPVSFKVSEDLKIQDQVVVKQGSIVKGTISAAQKSGFMGKGGQLSVRIESVLAVDGQKIKLRSSKGREGNNATGSTIALTVLFGPLGLLKKGKEAIIKPGTKIKVYTDEEKKVKV
ncbi:MAG: hypothetical protein NVSMB56_16410 [Pyrinomonadaceae bacterium]